MALQNFLLATQPTGAKRSHLADLPGSLHPYARVVHEIRPPLWPPRGIAGPDLPIALGWPLSPRRPCGGHHCHTFPLECDQARTVESLHEPAMADHQPLTR